MGRPITREGGDNHGGAKSAPTKASTDVNGRLLTYHWHAKKNLKWFDSGQLPQAARCRGPTEYNGDNASQQW